MPNDPTHCWWPTDEIVLECGLTQTQVGLWNHEKQVKTVLVKYRPPEGNGRMTPWQRDAEIIRIILLTIVIAFAATMAWWCS